MAIPSRRPSSIVEKLAKPSQKNGLLCPFAHR